MSQSPSNIGHHAPSITAHPLFVPRRFFRLASALTTSFYALMVEYRVEIILWGIATSLPLIMMGVWSEAAGTGEFTLDRVGMIRYFLAVFIVRQFTVVWVIHDFEWHVVSGRLTPFLIAPLDPWWRFFFIHVAEQLCRLPIVILLLAGSLLLFPEALWGDGETHGLWTPSWDRVALAAVATYLGFILRWWMQYAMAMGAFWLERVSSAHDLLFLPYLFLSGMVFPLGELSNRLPESATLLGMTIPIGSLVYELTMLTPFPYMLWFPAILISTEGDAALGGVSIPRAFATLVIWIGLMIALQRFLWRLGTKHYSAMGA
ncbi:MAG: multidrug ABC transporter permease [Planctomycetota bacterium]